MALGHPYADRQRYDVILVGALCHFDLIFAEGLSAQGLRCAVVRLPTARLPTQAEMPVPLTAFKMDDIFTYENPTWFFRFSRRAGCIISITSILPYFLMKWWLLLPLIKYPPIVNISTGSDVAELARERSLAGSICRSILRRAMVNLVPAYPEILRTLSLLRLKNFELFRYDYWLAPRPVVSQSTGPIVFFHPSHLDWGQTDAKANRNSTKGNDRFLRAFFRAAKAGADIRCIILDRGPDRAAARKMIEASGYSGLFEWLPQLSQAELRDRILRSDVIVDQFDVGGFGGISIEAMAQGKPVMIYINDSCWPLVYDIKPPVISCQTEDEIFLAITACQDRKALGVLGETASNWVDINYRSRTHIKRLASRIAMALGKAWPLVN
jgi:hypothetical protein